MSELITIGPGTDIDLADLVQSRMLIQGNSGSGKSALARKIIEETFGKVPFVVWDVEGEYYTLKELSGDIVIIGGQYADVPNTIELAEKLPAFIISNQLSVVVDLSDFKSSERVRFTKLFFESLMDLNMKYWKQYFFFLEECETLAGEQEKQESYPGIKDLLTRGRKRGYCAVVITQRIGMLKKSIAAQCNNKFIGKTVLDIDMDRSAKELGFSKAIERLKLRDLKRGHFYAYGSSLTPQHVHEVVVDKPKTTMVKAGTQIDFKPGKPTPKLLGMLAKLSEPVKKEVREKNIPQNADHSEEINVLTEQLEKTKAYVFELQNEIVSLKEAGQTLKDVTDNANSLFEIFINRYASFKFPMFDRLQNGYNTPTLADIAAGDKMLRDGNYKFTDNPKIVLSKADRNGELAIGEKAILIACYQFKARGGLSRSQLCMICGYKRSSINTYIQKLCQKHYLEEAGNKFLATKAGVHLLGNNYQPLPQGKALQQYWLNNLPEGERKIFEILVNQKRWVARNVLEDATEYARSSVNTYLQKLASREIVETGKEGAKAAEFLYD